MDIHSIYMFIIWWTLGLSAFLVIMNNLAMNICVQFLCGYVFIYLGYILEWELLDHIVT